MSETTAIAIISGVVTFMGGLLTVLFVTRKQATADLRRGNADATKTLQEVLGGMGDVYDRLVKNVRQSVESQIRTEYEQRLDDLEERIRFMEQERAEWQIGIGLLLGQLASLEVQPTWKPRITDSGKLKP